MIKWLTASLLATSALLVLVLLLRGPVLRTFGPKIAYALWALPAVRLILPPLPIPFAPLPKVVAMTPLAADLPTGGPDVVSLLGLAWAVGAVGWFGWQMLRYRVFLTRTLSGATRLGAECGVEVLMSTAVTGPMATGVIVRRILLPTDFMDRYSRGERRLALLHEGAHHDRGDILANFLALGFVAAHWWNPLAHAAYRRFRADQELACDATVLNGGSQGTDRQTYGSALLKSASAPVSTVACALSHKDEVRKRIITMMHPGFGIGRRLTGMGGTTALVLAGAMLTATAQAASPDAMRDMSAWFAPTVRELDRTSQDMKVDAAAMEDLAAESRRDAAEMTRDSRDLNRAASTPGNGAKRR